MITAIVAAVSFVTILVTTSILIVKGTELKKDYDDKLKLITGQINEAQNFNSKIDEKNYENINDVRKTYATKDEIARSVNTKSVSSQYIKAKDIEVGTIKGEYIKFANTAAEQMKIDKLISQVNVFSDVNALNVNASRINLVGNESGKGAINFGSSINGANAGDYLLQRGVGDFKDDIMIKLPENSSFSLIDKNNKKAISLEPSGSLKVKDWQVRAGSDYLGLGIDNNDVVKVQKNSLLVNTNNQDGSKYAFQAWNGKNEVFGAYNDGIIRTHGGNKTTWNVQLKNANDGAIMMNHGDGLGISVNTNNKDKDKYAFQAWNGKSEILGVYNDGVIRGEGTNKEGWNVNLKGPNGGEVVMNRADGYGMQVNTNNQDKAKYAFQAFDGKRELLGVYNDGVITGEGMNKEGWNVNLKGPNGGGVVMNRADGYGMQVNTNNQDKAKYAFQAFDGKNELLGVYNDGVIKSQGMSKEGWNVDFKNPNGGGIKMNTAAGMGVSINTNNQDKNMYALQAWNGKNELLGVYNDGEIRWKNRNGSLTHFNYPDGKNYIRGNTVINEALQVNNKSIDTFGLINVVNSNPGPMIEKSYGGNQGDRYGIGQFPTGAMRMYAARSYGPSTTSLSYAEPNGDFKDILTVSQKDGDSVTINGQLKWQNKNGSLNQLNFPDGKNYIRSDTIFNAKTTIDTAQIGKNENTSINFGDKEIKMRGDKNYSVFNASGSLQINDTSGDNILGTPGTNIVTIDPSKVTLKADSSFCISDSCIDKANINSLKEMKALQNTVANLQKQITNLTPQQLTSLQNQYQQQIQQTQTQINQIATQQAAQQTLTIQQQINAINATLNSIKSKMFTTS